MREEVSVTVHFLRLSRMGSGIPVTVEVVPVLNAIRGGPFHFQRSEFLIWAVEKKKWFTSAISLIPGEGGHLRGGCIGKMLK